ncbi:hypothetical protein JCM10512_4366 [Bacteroides reticulotermitis JCM 10512]|uniref:Uncharacterized protein n=1 Tax=Bacteroides reticulotermitis JCM 10512 TaxID=1445607 RepID=W4UY86_9BACE|nr:hypothetical protein JCM10512_4366 [Bacteroides reticulotermitis JCM 10512]
MNQVRTIGKAEENNPPYFYGQDNIQEKWNNDYRQKKITGSGLISSLSTSTIISMQLLTLKNWLKYPISQNGISSA